MVTVDDGDRPFHSWEATKSKEQRSTPGDERKIGSVQRVMIDKVSGKVVYAVTSFGGFLGMGEDQDRAARKYR